MDGHFEFLQAWSETIPIIITHGGYLHDFPILLANCMKNNYETIISTRNQKYSIMVIRLKKYYITWIRNYCSQYKWCII